jgi:hypothetical protein
MLVSCAAYTLLTPIHIREELSDQKALADEIGSAIANGPQAGEPIDEDELNEELGQMEQEQLDNQLLKTGTVPVLPSGPNAERRSCCTSMEFIDADVLQRPRRRPPRKRTKKPSWRSCKPKWPCRCSVHCLELLEVGEA